MGSKSEFERWGECRLMLARGRARAFFKERDLYRMWGKGGFNVKAGGDERGQVGGYMLKASQGGGKRLIADFDSSFRLNQIEMRKPDEELGCFEVVGVYQLSRDRRVLRLIDCYGECRTEESESVVVSLGVNAGVFPVGLNRAKAETMLFRAIDEAIREEKFEPDYLSMEKFSELARVEMAAMSV